MFNQTQNNHKYYMTSLVGLEGIPVTNKIGGSDQPSIGIVIFPAGNR